jgi:hypothetical protein
MKLAGHLKARPQDDEHGGTEGAHRRHQHDVEGVVILLLRRQAEEAHAERHADKHHRQHPAGGGGLRLRKRCMSATKNNRRQHDIAPDGHECAELILPAEADTTQQVIHLQKRHGLA